VILLLTCKAAEEKKFSSIKLSEVLVVQTKAAEEKKAAVQKDLASVEPMLKEAQDAVAGVNPADIKELQKLATGKPPPVVEMVVQSVLVLLGKSIKDPKTIKSEVTSPTFFKSVR
jgi:hypothetical protein